MGIDTQLSGFMVTSLGNSDCPCFTEMNPRHWQAKTADPLSGRGRAKPCCLALPTWAHRSLWSVLRELRSLWDENVFSLCGQSEWWVKYQWLSSIKTYYNLAFTINKTSFTWECPGTETLNILKKALVLFYVNEGFACMYVPSRAGLVPSEGRGGC